MSVLGAGSIKRDLGVKLAKYFNKNNMLMVDLWSVRAHDFRDGAHHDREHQAATVPRAEAAAPATQPRGHHRKSRALGQQSGASAAEIIR